jgi:hypothetical protein
MMFTESCLDHLKLSLENTHVQMEEYEHLGEVKTYNMDLHQRYREIIDERRIVIDEKDADIVFNIDFSTPPPVTWEWIQDPVKRNLWGGHIHWYAGDRPKGRAGKGASNHCAHGKSLSTEVTLDWHPFEYSTVDSFENGKRTFTETFHFEPLPDGGTRVRDIMQMHVPLPRFIRRVMVRTLMVHQYKYDQLLQKAAQLAAEEYHDDKT